MVKNRKTADLIHAYKIKVHQLTQLVKQYKENEVNFRNSLSKANKIIAELKETRQDVKGSVVSGTVKNTVEIKRIKEKAMLLIQEKEREINQLLHEQNILNMQYEEKEKAYVEEIAELNQKLTNSVEAAQCEKKLIQEMQEKETEFQKDLTERNTEIIQLTKSKKQLTAQLEESMKELETLKESMNQQGEIIQILHQKEAEFERKVHALQEEISTLQENIPNEDQLQIRGELEKEIKAIKKREQQKDQIIERFQQKELRRQEELERKKHELKECHEQVNEKEKLLQEWENLEEEITRLLEREEEYLREVHRLSEALKASIEREQQKSHIMKLSELEEAPKNEEILKRKKPWFQFLQGWGTREEDEVFIRNKK